MKKYRQEIGQGKQGSRKQITDYIDVFAGESLKEIVQREAKSLGMETWGNLMFYIGKIKREACIQTMARLLHLSDDEKERPEKSYDEIAIASFQTTNDGKYIQGTFSFSTILWALSKIKTAQNGMISDTLSVREYRSDLKEMEKKLFPEEEKITVQSLEEIYSFLKREYLDPYLIADDAESVQKYIGLKVQLFKDKNSQEKLEDDNYLGLSHDYFSEDLAMVKKWVTDGEFQENDELSSLISYIGAAAKEEEPWNRHDIVHPETPEDLEKFLLEALHVNHAPIGKWPSRYNPALMQQVAVNFAVSRDKAGIFEECGSVFSVNGPPGTGKTTLLKEIVSGNIVEKAKLLSDYDDPDDAFVAHAFQKGTKIENAYSKFHRKWYSLKNEKINDYGVLAASCNNAAVENITKELPIEKGIQDNLKIDEKNDDREMRRQLAESAALFSVAKSVREEQLYTKNKEKNGTYKEIYFSGYAQSLFGPGAWGLVAAPLGKKSNLQSFYYNVLYPLRRDFQGSNDAIAKRKDNYKEARNEFLLQLSKVEEMQKRLAEYCLEAESYTADLKDCSAQIESLRGAMSGFCRRKEETENQIEEHSKKWEETEKALKTAEEQERQARIAYETIKRDTEEIIKKPIKTQENIVETEKAVGFLDKIFKTQKYKSTMELIELYHKQRAEEEKEAEAARRGCDDAQEKLSDSEQRKATAISDKDVYDAQRKRLETSRSSWNQKIEQCGRDIEEEENRREVRKTIHHQIMESLTSAEATKRGVCIDDSYVAELMAEDAAVSTKAQTSDPWVTDEYNREREKLLYFALQLTREFVLASKSCRENFALLGQYWGYELGDENERIQFDAIDREGMAGALLQTLFLLVPVISSTFASVHTLLKDIKTPGVIGTLIIDEAGQAQPQMAVGALFRSRRAVIVGDPNQVEPVVTDDLELLRKCYATNLLRRYQDKSWSVQKFADRINPFGTYLENGTDYPDWLGCPLLVHRRCIDPMFEISNQISYGNIMKQQTRQPSKEKEATFIFSGSRWIHVVGEEKGNKNHYVEKQGVEVCNMLNVAYQKSARPSLYIISPFTSVVRGIRETIKEYCRFHPESPIAQNPDWQDWIYSNIGTVHTFQGKEADEVIFLLGCDRKAAGAIQWVNANIVNVAVTRAKYRLYVIGDHVAWSDNRYLKEAKAILDTFALNNISKILVSGKSEEEIRAQVQRNAEQLPAAESFVGEGKTDENGEQEFCIDTNGFVSNLKEKVFLNQTLKEEQLRPFGFESLEELESLPGELKNNLTMGIKLYYLLLPVYAMTPELDASCCAILFCKSLELQLRNNFADGLKKVIPDFQMGAKGMKLKDARSKDFMMGTVRRILNKNVPVLSRRLAMQGENAFDER
ncbi:MAG: AAA domain-containing protein [Eubacteriales bacterium]|nr:AAA domain-containing protein [Eubacteriales bacterium]